MKKRSSGPVDYEVRLKGEGDLWLRETSSFFSGSGTLHRTLNRLASQLESAGIEYAIIGALALGCHGFIRATVDIDLLLSEAGLKRFRSRLVGAGFRPAFPGARKSFRSTDTGVRVDVITAGEYPGDGKPKAVRFPDPGEASTESNGLRFLNLEKLVELKLASGLSAPHRMRDLVDIQDLIRVTALPPEFADRLDPSVRAAFQELWQKAQTIDPLGHTDR
jgi:hypothetical protein